MENLIQAVSVVLNSVSQAMRGKYQSPSTDVQRWSKELKNDTSIPSAHDDKQNLRSDVSRVGRSLKKAIEKGKHEVAY